MGVRLGESEQVAFLERGHTGVLTTLRSDGWPVSLPVWYVVRGAKVYISTPPAAAKLKRIRHDDRCSFLVESGDAWVDLAAVQFNARVVVLEPGAEFDEAHEALLHKYEQFRPPAEHLPDVTRNHYADQVVLRLDPVGPALSWDNSRIRLKRTS